jgi:hypothetical protein
MTGRADTPGTWQGCARPARCDVGYSLMAGVQGDAAFGPLVDLALPGVDRADRGEVVRLLPCRLRPATANA